MPEVTKEVFDGLDKTIQNDGFSPPMRRVETPIGIVRLYSHGDKVVCLENDKSYLRINGINYSRLRIDFRLNEVLGSYERHGPIYMTREGGLSSSDYTHSAMDKVYNLIVPFVIQYMKDHREFVVEGHIHNNRRKIEREVEEYDSLIRKALESKEKLDVLVHEGRQWYNPILPKRNWVVDGTFTSNGVGVPNEG